jgi:hypothetical protein
MRYFSNANAINVFHRQNVNNHQSVMPDGDAVASYPAWVLT